MDGYELNKFMGAITGALAIFMGITFVVEGVFDADHGGHHGEEAHLAFAMPIDDGGAGEPAPVVEVVPMSVRMAEADAAAGAKVFKKCQSCHKIEEGGGHGQGPELWGIMGREIAVAGGFSYSGALTGKEGGWTWEAMDAFLKKPADWAPGTRMGFAGLKKDKDRANIMAYLNENSGSPIALPTAE